MIYPNNKENLILWLKSNDNYMKLYNSLNHIIFDVTLRDGLQGVKSNDISYYTTIVKKKIYENIKNSFDPNFIEIGSVVSKNIFPIFEDTIDLFNFCIEYDKYNNNFLLIPNINQYNKISNSVENINICQNISLITSVSETFQKINTKKSLDETKIDLIKIINEIKLNKNISNPIIKLYISCIDACPYSGKIPISFIIDELKWYWNNLHPNIICLSDTCGKLTNQCFMEIITTIKQQQIMPLENISLHLHANENEYDEIKKIFFTAFDEKITHFDLSLLNSGGCIVTLKEKIKPNISYSLYYKLLVDWILSKS